MTTRTRGLAILLLGASLVLHSGCATGSPRARGAAEGAAKGAAVGAMGAGLGVVGAAIGTLPLGVILLPFAPPAMAVGAVAGAGVGAAVGALRAPSAEAAGGTVRAPSAENNGHVAAGPAFMSPNERAIKEIACRRRHLEFRSDWRDRLPEYRACLAD